MSHPKDTEGEHRSPRIRDDDTVELHDGDHFFARPPGSAGR